MITPLEVADRLGKIAAAGERLLSLNAPLHPYILDDPDLTYAMARDRAGVALRVEALRFAAGKMASEAGVGHEAQG